VHTYHIQASVISAFALGQGDGELLQVEQWQLQWSRVRDEDCLVIEIFFFFF